MPSWYYELRTDGDRRYQPAAPTARRYPTKAIADTAAGCLKTNCPWVDGYRLVTSSLPPTVREIVNAT